MAVRSQDRAKTAIDDLWQSTGKTAVFLKLDLSDLHSVKAAAKEFLRSFFSTYFFTSYPDVVS